MKNRIFNQALILKDYNKNREDNYRKEYRNSLKQIEQSQLNYKKIEESVKWSNKNIKILKI